ncbi:hypothetical protein KFK09_014028 [Dendrobium nobile]|uniref:TOD1/MUCI70 glycosyltransferase-like domain-containing protein n=1 Tax=Dendrobium nobile TaxID=94219 RepID=A0A8T3B8U8_DENNO|nr:hypothetical protein KFK09_014028 [Dendrobium nobile]
MAQHRQSGTDRFSARSQIDVAIAGDQIGLRMPQKIGRIRRAKPQRHFSYAAVVIGVTLLVGFFLSILAFHRLSGFRELPSRLKEYGEKNKSKPRPRLERTMAFKELRFGHLTNGSGRDSRDWDRDDRRRDDDYSEEEATGRKSGNDSGKIKLPEEGTAERAQGKSGRGRLYNEGGRKELDSYRKKYEDSLNNGARARDDGRMEQANPFDEYDDGFDEQDEHEDLRDEGEHWAHSSDSEVVSGGAGDEIGRWSNAGGVRKGALSNSNVKAFGEVSSNVGRQSQMEGGDGVGGAGRESSSGSGKKVELKRKPKHHKSSRSSCEMKFLDSTALLVEPLENKKFSRFTLQYVEIEERPSGTEDWEPRFAGHQSPREREHSYYAHDQKINCGFIKGPPGLRNTGFDLAEDDIKYMSSCHIAVSSCIFGNSDHLRTPYLKTVSHEYSIWLDSKLRLQNDPYLILEYFLWRRGYEYAISNHYDRHCVWEEVAQNKKLNKYNHTVIDQQFEFYQSDGLKQFDPSDPNKLLPSYVPEGSFIVRAHTPMSNLFSCLWFNEVDHWTPRDQLSFAYTFLKFRRKNPDKNFHLNMFKDCERRSIAKLFRHRAEDRRNISIQ